MTSIIHRIFAWLIEFMRDATPYAIAITAIAVFTFGVVYLFLQGASIP